MRPVCVFVVFQISIVAALAQESRGTITGTVLDSQGAAMPGVSILAKHVATNVETKTTTNDSGSYVLPFLNTGTYTVTATASGFKSTVRNNILLGISEKAQVDFQLEF
jgi:hypothetical protein